MSDAPNIEGGSQGRNIEPMLRKNRAEFFAMSEGGAKQMKLTVAFVMCAGIISAGFTFILPNIYIATSAIMPPQQQDQSVNAVLGQLVGSGASLNVGAALGLKNPNDLYVGILKSQTITDKIIQRFKLRELYEETYLEEVRQRLQQNTDIAAGKDGLIKIQFEDESPNRAVAIANAYVQELELLTSRLAITEAAQRSHYYSQRLEEALVQLGQAETVLKSIQEKTGLLQLSDQAKAIFEAVGALRGQISAKEVEIASLSAYATAVNPNYIRATQELARMREQLAGLERNNKLGEGDILLPTGKIPEAGMAYLRGLRQFKYQ